MQSSFEELPDGLYTSWCQLYNAVAFNYLTRVNDLLEDPNVHINIRIDTVPLFDVQALAADLRKLVDRLANPDDHSLLDAYAYLQQLNRIYYQLYARQTEQSLRSRTPPEVRLNGQRYVLVSPVCGPILQAVPLGQRIKQYDQIGNKRILGPTYRWEQIAAETRLDWGRELCLNPLTGQGVVRIAVSPFANNTDMDWDCYDAHPRPTDGAVPLRCTTAKDLDNLWHRLTRL